jgi:hypothetical protein
VMLYAFNHPDVNSIPSGFTSGQIGGIMGACASSPANASTIGPSPGHATTPASALA